MPDEAAEYRNSIGMEFVLIPAGEFMMGSENGEDDEKPVHQVIISRSYYLGKFVVTQVQWETVTGNNPSHFTGSNLPVEMVSWEDCQEFIQRLNAWEGGTAYRLPTEAEWERACRTGTTEDDMGNLDAMAWYDKTSYGQTHPVGQKQPNAWGLYDMHGNVWEWCQDWYDSYPSGTVTDPVGPSSGSRRVVRGGGWGIDAPRCRSACRGLTPAPHASYLGVRLLRTAG